MPYQLDSGSKITSWLTNSEFWDQTQLTTKHQQQLYPKQVPSPLLSKLSLLFVNTVAYYNLTKQEALDTIGYFLYEHNDLIHSQLFHCFLDHGLLSSVKNNPHYTINCQNLLSLTGIFLPLTKCYSPSCQINDIRCYSSLCPNKRISSLLHIVNYQRDSTAERDKCVINDMNNTTDNQQIPKDWIESIPRHIRDSTSRKELKRQAGIAELVLTEKNYCQDLDILHRVYAIPLLETSDIIANPSRRRRFYNNVFGNYLDITHLQHSFYAKLTSHNRQSSFFIGRVGTIIMQHVTSLIEPYILYASNHVKAIYCMTIEHKNNPSFARFLETQNAKHCTRRLGLRHYLTSPTLWIGKLKLMVEAVLKNTVDDADQLSLKASLAILHDTLCRMNSSATSNTSPEDFRFEELSSSIYKQTSSDLQLLTLPDNSVLIREESLWLARSSHPLFPSLCHLLLFSHALILTHPRVTNGRTEYIVIPGSPIPIQFLLIDSNVTSSMMRRLSFASTSIVSTPLHLISNLRRQKSMNSDASNTTNESSESSSSGGSNFSNTSAASTFQPHTKLLGRSKTATHAYRTAPKQDANMDPTTTSDRKTSRAVVPFQMKTRFSKFKINFRWSMTSVSMPVSPSTPIGQVSVTRRDSAPAMLFCNSRRGNDQRRIAPVNTNDTATIIDNNADAQQLQQQRQQRRTLKICHMAYPENTFKLEFLSRADRAMWEDAIRDVIGSAERKREVFKQRLICKSLYIMSASRSTSSTTCKTVNNNTTNTTNTQQTIINNVHATRITCSHSFAYADKNTGYHENLTVFGTQYGVWMCSRDASKPFRLILPNHDVQQISVLENKLIVLVHDNKQSMLIAYALKFMIEAFNCYHSSLPTALSPPNPEKLDWCMIKSSMVTCFTVGKIRDQPVIVYLTKRYQTTWLVIIIPNYDNLNTPPIFHHSVIKNHWYKKYRTEYQVSVKDPTDIQIMHDAVFIRSEKYGIERVDIFKDPSVILHATTNWVFLGTNTGLISDTSNGTVCDTQHAYSVSLFDKHSHKNEALLKIKFESQVHHVAMVYPYLIAFSSSVIEVRNIDTTELVQVIRGSRIKFISITNDHTQPLFFAMANRQDSRITSIYQLQLCL